jgi:hypothetical protein
LKKLSPRNKKILLFSFVFVTVFGILFYYNWQQYQKELNQFQSSCSESNCLKIYGNVDDDLYIGISALLDDTFDREENIDFFMINRFSTEFSVKVSGVQLFDVLGKADILSGNATRIIFESIDGFKSFELPISIIKNNPTLILIVTHVNGVTIPSKDNGGDGPLKSVVSYDTIKNNTEIQQIFAENNVDFVFNTIYNVKYLSAIKII